MLPPIRNSRRRSLLRRNAGPLYVKDGLKSDWARNFNSNFDSIQDRTVNDNDLTLYSGRYPSFDGVQGSAVFGPMSLLGVPARITGRAKPDAGQTEVYVRLNGQALSATVVDNGTWQDFEITSLGAQDATPTDYTLATDGTNFFAGGLSDVSILDVVGNELHNAPLTSRNANDLVNVVAFDTVAGNHGTFTAGSLGNTGEGIDTEVVGTLFEENEDKLWLDGVNDYVDVGSPIIDLSNPWSIRFMMKSNGASGRVYSIGNSTSDTPLLLIGENNAKMYVFYRNNSGVSAQALSTADFFDNTLLHVEVTYNGAGTLSFFKNGDFVSSHSVNIGGPLTVDRSSIGCVGRTTNSNFFKGLLYDIEIDQSSSPLHRYQGYGNTDADWIDQEGTNNGTVNGNPATVGQKRATILQTAGTSFSLDSVTYASTVLVPQSLTNPSQDAAGNLLTNPRINGSVINIASSGEFAQMPDNISLEAIRSLTVGIYNDGGTYDVVQAASGSSFVDVALNVLQSDQTGATFYVNGTATTTLSAGWNIVGVTFSAGKDLSGGKIVATSGAFLGYDPKALTSDEHLQNYNAFKGDFKL